jgi:putative redox protein
MDVKAHWKGNLAFEAVADSNRPITIDSPTSASDYLGPAPMEMIASGMAGCTAMDIMSILAKKKQDVTNFDVLLHADRAGEHPKVFTSVEMVYEVTGHAIDESAVVRAIELSVQKYCPAHAMMRQVFPISQRYVIFEDEGNGARRVVAEGNYIAE